MGKMLTFSSRVNEIFEKHETTYDGIKNLMFDLASGEDIYNEDGNKVSKAEANTELRSLVYDLLGLQDGCTKRDRERAMKKNGDELFSVIEEVVDIAVETGFKDTEFFNQFVEYRNIAVDDIYDFQTVDKTILAVAKVVGQHHDTVLQRLGEGEHFTVPVNTYRVAVGATIDRYLVGQEDWATLVGKIAEAFTYQIQADIYTAAMNAYLQIPAPTEFVGNGALTLASKDAFDEIIENVETANNSGSIIMGTKSALKKLDGLVKIDWIANSQKESVAAIGRLGNYETSTLVEIPQRFAANDVTRKLVNNKILLILPTGVENKFVYMIDSGETRIAEVPMEKNKNNGRLDDVAEYEVTRGYGIATRIGRYYGAWTLPA